MYRLWLLIALSLQVGLAFAQGLPQTPQSPSLFTLGPMDAEVDSKTSVITLRYETKPGFAQPKIEAHSSFIQVLLPQTLVPKPGVFIDAGSPYIRKFAAFQIDADTAAIRLFVSKEAEHILPAVKTDILENRVLIILDHAEAEKQLVARFDGVPVQGGPSPEEVIQKTEVKKDIPSPSPVPMQVGSNPSPLAALKGTESSAAANEDLKGKLTIATIFIAVMLILLIGFKSWRRVMSKKWPLAAESEFRVKTLATHVIGPKQKLTVVEVGQEQILLGVSPDSINFLTSLRKTQERLTVDPSTYMRSALQQTDLSPREPQPEKPKVRPRSTPKSELPEPGSAIQYGISDQGIKNLRQSQASKRQEDPRSVDDVTRLIRKKLKDLPKV